MSLLTIVQEAAVELGFAAPSAVIASTDPTVKLLRRLAQKELRELVRRCDWQRLHLEGTFTTTATATQVATVSAAFNNFSRIINGSMWNRTQSRPVYGPLTAAEWQQKNASAAQASVNQYFRIRTGRLLFFPAPPSGDTIVFEYITNRAVEQEEGTATANWTTDADFARIDEEVVCLGVIWRYRKNKGFDYSEDFRTYEMALQDIFGPDGGKSTVDMTGEEPVGGVNLADGSWNIT